MCRGNVLCTPSPGSPEAKLLSFIHYQEPLVPTCTRILMLEPSWVLVDANLYVGLSLLLAAIKNPRWARPGAFRSSAPERGLPRATNPEPF